MCFFFSSRRRHTRSDRDWSSDVCSSDLADFNQHGIRKLLAKGGKGGLGNVHFKSSTNRAPRQFTEGEPGQEFELYLELKVLADVGLLGMPNAGKSSLIRQVSAAKPKIADYPFTTLQPNLGVVKVYDQKSFVMADIPGLIEGASDGHGLGHQFLRHLSRTKILLHLVDVAPYDERIDTIEEIKKIISEEKINPKKDIMNEVNLILKNYIITLMKPLENQNFFDKKETLNAVLISGVNGVGKTTTIGKIGKILKSNGNKVMFSACDTFRAAAIEQLESWANKINIQIIKSSQGSDPASVAYKAIEEALKEGFNHVLIDTAGRLQNKKNLMEEYKKIANVTKKIDPNAPHDVILVLDATSGQNVINQVEEFNKIIPVTGLIMTKLDGTAKGGILLALAKKYQLPIIALGLGEKEDDLQIFNAEKFAEAFININ